MRRLLRWYGASPLHLLALAGCFALAGYAADRLVPSNPMGVGIWFLGAVVGHDLVLMPLYSLADLSVAAVIRHRAAQSPAISWINYLRVPAAASGLLFVVWFPLILRLHTRYEASTTLSADPFLWHWLGVTGALFLLSAVAFALRVRFLRRPAAPPAQGPAQEETSPRPLAPPSGAGTGDADHAPDPGQHPPAAEPSGPRPADDGGRGNDPGTDPPARENDHPECPGD
ncbi:MAG: hypothetical protein JWM19_69 [Actinomycetia bacterium]|nr:hypothetical protein [Actinomycetes bacterium]